MSWIKDGNCDTYYEATEVEFREHCEELWLKVIMRLMCCGRLGVVICDVFLLMRRFLTAKQSTRSRVRRYCETVNLRRLSAKAIGAR